MAGRLPPHYIELVADAALKCYWRHAALSNFLRRCGVASSFLAGWVKPESKRDFLNRLFPKLEVSGDDGLRLIHRMADALIQHTAFPDLDGWEDSKQKKDSAIQALAALRAYRKQQAEEVQDKREREATRKRVQQLRDEAQKKKEDLQKFADRLADLSKSLGSQKAGYDFQDWFYDLADFFEVVRAAN